MDRRSQVELAGDPAGDGAGAADPGKLFQAEQEARRQAEAARDRTRRLQTLTAALSGVIERHRVVAIMVDAGRDALGAAAGFAWLLRDDATLELAGFEDPGRPDRLAQFRTIPMTTRMPVCDAVRTARPLMFEDRAAMVARYPDSLPPGASPFAAFAVIPFVVDGRGIGAASFSFADERAFSDDDRALLDAMTGQAALA